MKINARMGICAYLICTLLPVVAYLSGGYLLMAICAFAVMLYLYRYGKYGKIPSLMVPFLCLYFFDIFSAAVTGSFSLVGAYSMLAAYLPVFWGIAVWDCNSKQAAGMVKLIMLLHFVVAVSSVFVLVEDPNAARYLATGQTDSYSNSLYLRNTADYSLVYTQAISLPMFALAYRKSLIRWWQFVGYLIAVSVMVVYANYALAIMVWIVALVSCFLPKSMSRKQLILLVLAACVIIFIAPEILAWLVNGLTKLVQNDKVVQKLSDVATLLQGDDVKNEATTGRLELYDFSFRMFLRNPLLGHWYQKGIWWGGHSFLLDTLAKYGIGGGVLLVFLYKTVYRNILAPYRHTDKYVPLFVCFVLGLMVSAINTGIWANVTVMYSSILLKALERKKETKA